MQKSNFFPVYSQRQYEEAVKHGKESIALFDFYQFKAFKLFCAVIFDDKSQFMTGIFQSFYHLSDIDGDAGFSVIKRNS